MAGWSSTAPSGVSFGTAKESTTWSLSQGHAMFTAAIARGATNTIYIKVDFKRAAYDGYASYDISMTATVAGSSVTATGKWGAYSATYNTYATRYYTGTAAPDATVTVSVALAGSSRTVSLTAPAYTTKYTIKYDANGGSGAPASQTKTYNTTLTLSSTRPTRTGYTFKGWATSSTATTAQYQPGGSYTANASATLYAVWSIIQYTITYKANGGTGADQTQTKNYGSAVTLKAADTFTRQNYTFLYWNTAADGSGTSYNAGASYNENAALTLYAIWKKNNIPVFVRDGDDIIQVEKAFMRVGDDIVECTIYQRIGDDIIVYQ